MDRDATVREHEAFRNLLQAMARPGTVRALAGGVGGGEAALDLLLDCVLDGESSLAVLDGPEAPLAEAAGRRNGCRRTEAGSADFVLAGPEGGGSRLASLRLGEPDYPDRSATVVYRVARLEEAGGSWKWTGPGIADEIRPLVEGLPDAEWHHLRMVNSVYPMGVDCVFVDKAGRIAAMPRSTRLEEV